VRRLREESGFGLLELLIAMVMLNVALFAIVGVFNATTVAIRRAGDVSAATAVADKQIEIYRSLTNCAIWLDHVIMPAAGSAYALDTKSYSNIAYWNPSTSASQQYWVTDAMDDTNITGQTNLLSCGWKAQQSGLTVPLTTTQGADNATTGIDSLGLVTPPTSTTVSAVKPIQTIVGPDGVKYLVYTYIILVQPTGSEWVKQVTVVVYDPHSTTRALARESSVFDPITGA
jgi:type II secretory pathway pseudopilin PulG